MVCKDSSVVLKLWARKSYGEAILNGLKCSVALDKEPNGNHEGGWCHLDVVLVGEGRDLLDIIQYTSL